MSFAGILRVGKDIVSDLFSSSESKNFIVDVPLLITLVIIFWMILKDRLSKISIYIGLLLIVLVAVSYFKLGGIRGSSEYNLMAVAFLITFGYQQTKFIFLNIIFLLIIIGAEIGLSREFPDRPFSTANLDSFLTTAIALTCTVAWVKHLLTKETEKILVLRNTLVINNKKLRLQHGELQKQKELLEISTNLLAKHEASNTSRIDQQRKAIDDFVILSTHAIRIPLEKMSSARTWLNGKIELEEKLADQIVELEDIITQLETDLEEHARPSIT